MFDNVCRFLSERFPTDIAAWLLGELIALTKLSPTASQKQATEPSLQPIRADALILLQSENLVLHVRQTFSEATPKNNWR